MFLNQLSGSCGTPSYLSNGQRRYSSTIVGSRVTYTCNLGYLRTAGSSSRTCQSNGLWSGSHPTCTRKSTLCHFTSFTYRLQTCRRIACHLFLVVAIFSHTNRLQCMVDLVMFTIVNKLLLTNGFREIYQ